MHVGILNAQTAAVMMLQKLALVVENRLIRILGYARNVKSMYNGITLILNKPSRFDLKSPKCELFTSASGDWFKKQLMKNGILFNECHVCTAKDYSIPEGTKCVMLLGEEAFRIKFNNPDHSLNEYRGYPYKDNDHGYVYLSSFTPQDSFDPLDYEGKFNSGKPSVSSSDESVESAESDEDETETKSHGKTRRKNFRFWLSKDIAKLCRIKFFGLKQHSEFENIIYPSADEVIAQLLQRKQWNLYFDIETDPETMDITVFSFMFENPDVLNYTPVYTVPVRRFNYETGYEILEMCKIFRALAVAFRDNTVVTHNGSSFDLFVLAHKYKISFGPSNYDTMLACHRCFPEVEKSLGHAISLFTDEPYHKNEAGVYVPFNTEQELALWKYNAKDVWTLRLVKHGIDNYAKKISAIESIAQANASISPYLTNTFHGIRMDDDAINRLLDENNRRVTQMLRILQILAPSIKNPNSWQQIGKYLYGDVTGTPDGGLGLTPPWYNKLSAVQRSKGQQRGNPSTDESALLELSLKHELPVIPVILEIRKIAKQSEAVTFEPWNYYNERYTTSNQNK